MWKISFFCFRIEFKTDEHRSFICHLRGGQRFMNELMDFVYHFFRLLLLLLFSNIQSNSENIVKRFILFRFFLYWLIYRQNWKQTQLNVLTNELRFLFAPNYYYYWERKTTTYFIYIHKQKKKEKISGRFNNKRILSKVDNWPFGFHSSGIRQNMCSPSLLKLTSFHSC